MSFTLTYYKYQMSGAAQEQYEEIMNLLETHDVGAGAMVYFFRVKNQKDTIQMCFLCRCREPNKITHNKLRGKKFQGKIWQLNERLFLNGWEPISSRDCSYYTWVKKGTETNSLVEC